MVDPAVIKTKFDGLAEPFPYTIRPQSSNARHFVPTFPILKQKPYISNFVFCLSEKYLVS